MPRNKNNLHSFRWSDNIPSIQAIGFDGTEHLDQSVLITGMIYVAYNDVRGGRSTYRYAVKRGFLR